MKMHPHTLCIFLLLLSSAFFPDVTQARNVVLVKGDPPLTQETMQQFTLIWEWYLGRAFTAEERPEWQEVITSYWPKRDKAEREKIIKDNRDLVTAYSRWSAYDKDLIRALYITKVLENLRNLNGDPERWILTKLETAYRPGGEQNPIIVPGDPPLTRLILDKNLVMIESAFEFNLSAAERDAYAKLFIQSWRQTDRQKKEGLIQDRESITSALAESKLGRGALASSWFTGLKTSTYPADQWLLARYNKALNDPSSALSTRMATAQATAQAIEKINNVTVEAIIAGGALTAAKTYSDITIQALPALGEHLRK